MKTESRAGQKTGQHFKIKGSFRCEGSEVIPDRKVKVLKLLLLQTGATVSCGEDAAAAALSVPARVYRLCAAFANAAARRICMG